MTHPTVLRVLTGTSAGLNGTGAGILRPHSVTRASALNALNGTSVGVILDSQWGY